MSIKQQLLCEVAEAVEEYKIADNQFQWAAGPYIDGAVQRYSRARSRLDALTQDARARGIVVEVPNCGDVA